MLNFDFLEKGFGIVSPPHSVHGFSRKMFPRLYSVNGTNFIVGLTLNFEIFDNMGNAIVCFPGFDVTKFEINFILLIKPFFYMTKKSRQKFKYLVNEKSF